MKTKKVPFDIEKVKDGAKVITRCGYPAIVMIGSDKTYPVRAILKREEGSFTYSFTVAGKFWVSENESDLDLFIEEEEKEKPRREYSGTDSIYVPKDDEGIREELIDAINGLWDNDALPMPLSLKRKTAWITWLEKQGEKNTADNKPEFQEGDWVIDGLGIVHQIIRVVENLGSHTYGYGTDDGFYIHDSESGVRLWNINDAKDGDVLAVNNEVFIYAHRKQMYPIAVAHCFVDRAGGFYLDGEFGYTEGGNSIYPATKEQRDLLFQKIKEAGYEWDSDKKELKKIEEVKSRRMTRQELSWWLRDCPEEHREYMLEGGFRAHSADYDYLIDEADEEVGKVYIRKNGGEWQEPLIEE